MTVGIEFERKQDIIPKMPLGRLGDHVEILSGFAFDSSRFAADGEMPLIRIRDVMRGRTGTYYSGPFDERFVVREGDLLVGMDGDFNRETWSSEPALLNQRVCRISPSDARLDDRYLYHFLPQALTKIWHATPFATVKHLSVKAIREIAVPMPPIEEQRRIGAILDKADELRTKRRLALAHLDVLIQSIFYTMFRDPVASAGWPDVALDDLLSAVESGQSPVCEDRPAGAEEWGVLKLSAVSKLTFDATHNKALISTPPNKQHEVRQGDVLFSRKNTRSLVAAVALVGEVRPRLLLPDLIFRLCIRNPAVITPEYLYAVLAEPTRRAQIQNLAGGSSGSMPNISKAKLLTVKIPTPPIELQREFGRRVSAVERLRGRQRSQLAELEVLFASLQNRAFSGEL